MTLIKLVLVDDEPHCLAALQEKLKLFDNIRILQTCTNGAEAIKAIETLKPDAIFLDISMPKMDGFTMLQEIAFHDFEIIFTTAHNEYAIQAIRLSAFDFLLKPVGMEDLKQCLTRLTEKLKSQTVQKQRNEQLNHLYQLIHQQTPADQKIALPTQNGFIFLSMKEIVRAEAESNYTFFYLSDGHKHVVSKTMKEFEDILCSHHFFRVHKSHIVNLNFVSRYIKGDGGIVVLSDGTQVEVSPSKKAALLGKLQGLQ